MDIETIKSALKTDGYCIVSSPEMKAIAVQARAEYLESMLDCPPNSPKKRMDPKDLPERPWRKFAIGSATGLGEPYAQLLQTTYFDENYFKYPALRTLFAKMIGLRNEISGTRADFGSVPARDGFWNACRIHHYPRGGAFMAAHRDTYFPKALKDAGHPFLQIMTTLSERTEDFFHGGGYIYDRHGTKIMFESKGSIGDLVFFDGDIIHGVEDVDGDQVIDFTLQSGRIAAFVNLYTVLPTT